MHYLQSLKTDIARVVEIHPCGVENPVLSLVKAMDVDDMATRGIWAAMGLLPDT